MAKSTNTRPAPLRRSRVSKSTAKTAAPTAARVLEIEPVEMETGAVDHTEIAGRAYELFLADGCCHGHDVDHWLRAERELLERRLTSAA